MGSWLWRRLSRASETLRVPFLSQEQKTAISAQLGGDCGSWVMFYGRLGLAKALQSQAQRQKQRHAQQQRG